MLAADRTGAPRTAAVAVVSSLQLVREAIGTALQDAGFAVLTLAPPRGADQLRAARRRLIRAGPLVGLLASELHDAGQLREAATVLHALSPDWLLMTSRLPGAAWGAMIELGARDVLHDSTHLDDLADRIARVAAGAPLPDSPARAAAIAAWASTPRADRLLVHRIIGLTHREMEILVELGNGDSAARIAARSGVATGTVHSQVRALTRKLEVRGTLQAVAAYRHVGDVLDG